MLKSSVSSRRSPNGSSANISRCFDSQSTKKPEGPDMTTKLGLIGAAVAAALVSASPAYCDVIKVGIIGTMSGPYALFGQNFKYGIDTWVAEHGSKVGDHEIQFIYRDEESPNPAKSKALAQELIVKDKVQDPAGFDFTPDARAARPLLEER